MRKRGSLPKLVLCTALLVAASGCGSDKGDGGSADDKATGDQTSTAAPTDAATTKAPKGKRGPKSATATPSAAPRVPNAGKPRAVVVPATVSVLRPRSWVKVASASSKHSLCIAPRGNANQIDGCGGIRIYFGDKIPGPGGKKYAANQPGGWLTTEDQSCPFGATGGSNKVVNPSVRMDKGTRRVGPRRAQWNRWFASCADGSMFQPQAWYFPAEKVLFVDYLEHRETPRVLKTARFAVGAGG